ncbi:MAG: hypothetical protein MJY99_10335 [Fibrobacter sp.]|nr:hypothetical protein [Fibrobacter sp.]
MKKRIWFSADEVYYIVATSNSPALTFPDGTQAVPNGIATIYYQSAKAKHLSDNECWVIDIGRDANAETAMNKAIDRLSFRYNDVKPHIADVQDQATELRRLLDACNDICSQGT